MIIVLGAIPVLSLIVLLIWGKRGVINFWGAIMIMVIMLAFAGWLG